MAVASFPLFALTFTMAQALTLLLYGQRYADSAVYMALLSFGYYFNTALGFNGLTLRIFGVIRYAVVINIVAAITNVALEPGPDPALRSARRRDRDDRDAGHPQPPQAGRAAARDRHQHLRLAAPAGLPDHRRGDGDPARGEHARAATDARPVRPGRRGQLHRARRSTVTRSRWPRRSRSCAGCRSAGSSSATARRGGRRLGRAAADEVEVR